MHVINAKKRVVIVGGGFGGLNAAQTLAKADVDVTLIDRRNFHLFQPLLYQVATGGLSPANIAHPLRDVLKHQNNARVLMADVTEFDVTAKKIHLKDVESIEYDFLILAAGARSDYFGHPEWEKFAWGLKSMEDATAIRRRIFTAFENAELEKHPERIKELLTFVIVGAGPTGVEMAGAISEIARDTLRQNFRNIDPASSRVVLVDGVDRVLAAMHPRLSQKAQLRLEQLGVVIHTRCRVTGVEQGLVRLESPEGAHEVRAQTIIWAAGVRASVLGEKLAAATGAQTDRAGRIHVSADLSVPGHPDIFIVGDMARVAPEGGAPLPGMATVAIQEGRYAAKAIKARIRGKALKPFKFFDKGSMATIGRAAAVAQIGRLKISGMIAWILWLGVHLMYIVSFGNRLLVLLQWGWSYFTFGRSARLITEDQSRSAATPMQSAQLVKRNSSSRRAAG
jgi:NADH dehydrogenase